MCHRINKSSTVELGKQVRRISINRSGICAGEEVTCDWYGTVFSTTTLACLQRIVTEPLHLDPVQEKAIRCLRYEDSTKVGIKFAYPWWIVDCGIRGGGSASSTLPSRTCGRIAEEDWDQPAVLLASYSWGQDATRMGALIRSSAATSHGARDEGNDLLDLVLRDLAQQHRQYGITCNPSTEIIMPSAGAIPAFRREPSHFLARDNSPISILLLSLPAADGKFHIVGKAASVHHGWVVGSLNSAYVAVYRFLLRYGQQWAVQKLEQNWGNRA
ncbi:Amine oxidase [Penicillium mononematosum]|uniref:Amine oxidase n=1 Tax=Penicillium mononematosum TaxID=268346 RepID=UPI0025478F71|nr:Amine oxidase [Penicillium mononematosum]KAJ6178535.1 Amine oxidase [Penicillium mononematosum]